MKLEQLKSKTMEKIHVHLNNKSKLAQKMEEKQEQINALEVEYELEEQAYTSAFNDDALKRMIEIKKEIEVLANQLKEQKRIFDKNSETALVLTEEDKDEIKTVFAKVKPKQDKLFENLLAKKDEFIAAYNQVIDEQEKVDQLFDEIYILLSSSVGDSVARRVVGSFGHISVGQINRVVKELKNECSVDEPTSIYSSHF
jgi:hypothetical protein